MDCLAVVETHPVQYRAPVYKALQQKLNLPVTAIYGSDFSTIGYHDKAFNANFAWDTDLLSGYSSIFLSRVRKGGACSGERVSARGLGNALRNINPKAVMITGHSPRFHQIAFYEAWRGGYPIIFRGETKDAPNKRNFFKSWLRARALSWMYRRCAKLLYIGERSFRYFRWLGYPDDKLIFSPYCVDTAPFKPGEEARSCFRSDTRKALGIEETDIALLFSGKLERIKNPGLILTAAGKLASGIRERTRVIFLGSGKLKSNLENLAKIDPKIKVRFTGFKNQSEISPYYHAADLLILPSVSETWGLVINEALHHGLPCVVSKTVGCAPDLIEPGATGEIFKTNSIEGLASSIERALKLVSRPEIRQGCREKVNGYTVEKAAEGIRKAYHEAINKDG